MAFTPIPPFPKSRGDNIRSTDWNDAITELQRLDTDKVDRAGDAITGSLTIAGALGIGTREPPKVPLAVTTDGADESPIIALGTPNNEDFLSIFAGRRGSQLPFITWKRGDLRFGTATNVNGKQFNEHLRITNAGDVGIGTAGQTPAAKLEVVGTSWNQHLRLTNVTTTGAGPALYFKAINRSWAIIGTNGAAGIGDEKLGFWDDTSSAYRLYIDEKGDIHVPPPSRMHFEAVTRQMINLWREEYGIGIQSGTQYFRTGAHFGWHRGGVHSDNQLDAGGGVRLMYLDSAGNLVITGNGFKPGGGSWVALSDLRLKQNVQPLTGVLDKLLRLRGVAFEWKEPEKQGNLTGAQIGVIAQEVEEVFPEWISADFEGNKQVGFRGFEALTVEAFREIKAEVVRLQNENRELAERVAKLEKKGPAPRATNAKK